MKGTASILLVDHSRVNLMLQETVLRRRDNVIHAVTAGTEAWDHIVNTTPDLVIFGFDLSDMSGPELCRYVRGDEKTKSVSLLFVSDRNAAQQGDLCLAAGCNDIIYRPFHRRDLDSAVEKLTRIPVRRELRTLTKLEITLHNEGYVLLGHSVNVSANGMLVQLDHLLPPEASVRLNFYLPGDPVAMSLEARVVRAEFNGSSPRYGVTFTETSTDQQGRIQTYVARFHARERH